MNQLPIIKRAIDHGNRTAVIDSGNEFTFSEILRRSHSLASWLLDGSTDLAEGRVAFLIPAGADYIATQWAVWRAGGIAVPLGLSATAAELEYTLSDAQVGTIVVPSQLADRIADLAAQHEIRICIFDELDESQSASLPEIQQDRRAMILYTSGTTSKPKGVVTTHRCITAQIESLINAWRWEADDRIPLFLPLHHIHGIINIMSCALWSGARIESFPRFDLQVVLNRVGNVEYSLFMAVPTIYVKLIEAIEHMDAVERERVVAGFADMRLMISGSAALPASVHQKWTELTGQKLLERYGMTEIGMALSNPYDGERRPGAVGLPLPGVEIRLVSDQGDVVEKEDVPGEIQVQGANVFQEYWNRSEPTAASFVDGWFRTGDIAVLERGYYRIMGRTSVDIIKSGGYKLSALEIEASLLDHPDITECAVIGMPDETWGESVAVAVVMKGTQAMDLDSLRDWCKEKVSHYKIPRKLLVLEQLPRNAMGKVTKPAVSKLFASRTDD